MLGTFLVKESTQFKLLPSLKIWIKKIQTITFSQRSKISLIIFQHLRDQKRILRSRGSHNFFWWPLK